MHDGAGIVSAVPDLEERLAARTLELVEVPSVSRGEAALLSLIREVVPSGYHELLDDEDAVLFYAPQARRPEADFVVLAGHVDTVPISGSVSGHREKDAIVGLGSSDMKGGIAVMLEVADALASGEIVSELDVGLVFFGREEIPITESALLPLFERCRAARTPGLAIVMEPTDNTIEIGCLGNLTANIVFSGRTAHSARPWLGSNAIHAAIRTLAPIADLAVGDVEIDGLVFREVLSVTSIAGGVAANVVPDRVEAGVNFRYAPNQTPAEAEERLRDLVEGPDVELEILGNAPPGPVVALNPIVTRLRAAGILEVGPKQAWTPVAEFAMAGVDAVNFGPGDPRYAHRSDERVEVSALVRSYEVLRAFLTGTDAEEAGP